MSLRAAAFFCDARKITRLEPPAIDTPGVFASRPGSGAVLHLSCRSAGRRRRHSPTFHGPLMNMAKSPCANC